MSEQPEPYTPVLTRGELVLCLAGVVIGGFIMVIGINLAYEHFRARGVIEAAEQMTGMAASDRP